MANIDIANPGDQRDRLVDALEDLVQYNIEDLLNVTTSSVANGYVLLYSQSNSTWYAAAIPSAVLSIGQLTDVNIVSPSNGHILYYNTSESSWQVTAPPPSIDELDDINNVNVSSVANGQVLSFSNSTSTWVPIWPVSDGDKGDITVSSNGTSWSIDTNAVTLPKIQTITTDRLLGRDTTGTGNVEQLTVTGGIEFSGSGGIRTSAFTGDVTKAAGGTATTIAANVVTNAKLTNVATQTIKGRNTAGTGSPEDLSVSTVRTMLSINNVDNTSDANKPVSTATQTALDLKANLNSPALTGTPTAPTPANNNNSNTIATTAYVDAMVAAGGGGGGSVSDGDKGDITVSSNGATWTIDSMVVTNAKLANVATQTIKGRNTAGSGSPEDLSVSTARTMLSINNVDNTSDANKPVSTATQTALDLKANLSSPALTGTPTAPTPANTSNANTIATTAFVQNNLLLAPVIPAPTSLSGAEDFNDLITAGWYSKLVVGDQTNGWGVAGEYGHLLVGRYSSNVAQYVFPYQGTNSVAFRVRTRISGTWGSWKAVPWSDLATESAAGIIQRASVSVIRAGNATYAIDATNAQSAMAWVTLTDGSTITVDHNNGTRFSVSTASARTITASNLKDGLPVIIVFNGNHNHTWSSTYFDFTEVGGVPSSVWSVYKVAGTVRNGKVRIYSVVETAI